MIYCVDNLQYIEYCIVYIHVAFIHLHDCCHDVDVPMKSYEKLVLSGGAPTGRQCQGTCEGFLQRLRGEQQRLLQGAPGAHEAHRFERSSELSAGAL